MRTTHKRTVDQVALATLCSPRDDIVREGSDGTTDDGAVRFIQVEGPFAYYERRVSVADPGPDGTRAVRESYRFGLPAGAWRPLTHPLLAAGLRRTALSRHAPWWAPTQRLDPRATTVLGLLFTLAIVVGYLSFLLSQTMTFAAEEFGAGKTAQGLVLSSARIGGALAILLTVLADRRGRRRLLLFSVALSLAATTAGALAPSLWALGLTQAISRGATTAAAALVAVVLAEEMPKGARAWALGQVTVAGGLGAGGALLLLPLADLGDRGWRLLYAAPLLVVPLVVQHARKLPETRRFTRPHRDLSLHDHMPRLWLIAGMSFLLNVFFSPVSQFRNEFLRDERMFDAAGISVFTAVSGGLAVVGVVIGGRLAERWGRRVLGCVTAAGTGVFLAASFSFAGPAMWATATVGMISMAALTPATALYGAELFPTSMRGRINGIVGAVAMGGSVVGLVTAGVLTDRTGTFGPTIAVLAVAPLLAALLILTRFPETARRELEDLNPEDRAPLDGDAGPASATTPAAGTAAAPTPAAHSSAGGSSV